MPTELAMPLVLASSSPTRRIVLEKLRIAFEVANPAIDESPMPEERPKQLVRRLAREKARAVANRYPRHLIIGCDQVAVTDGTVVGKPRDRNDAIRQLRQASGKSVALHTGLVLLNSRSGAEQIDVIDYRVEFRALSDAMIERYIDLDEPYDCGGSLRSEGLGIALLSKFDGDDPNALLGLPLIRLIDMLANEGVHPLPAQAESESATTANDPSFSATAPSDSSTSS